MQKRIKQMERIVYALLWQIWNQVVHQGKAGTARQQLENSVQYRIWQIWNRVVHQGKAGTARQQLENMWAQGIKQLRAFARRERNNPSSKLYGIRLKLSLDSFETMGIEAEATDPPPTSRRKCPRPALVKRTRQFQEAII
ncbi:hypothetical protein PHMEG_0001010 [Phytophthora megakarya]|uniref:RxLR effector protein n=1 Tax=Phytophthora megakarya TaxID=4795 RepID=A0A225X3U8_9STRA|nr:hypothetical protein PHMEG_0001010 [Phytophthora megakarya]